MVLAVAESNELTFEKRHLEEAISLLDELEVSMFDAFGAVGNNTLAGGLDSVKRFIEDKKSTTRKEIMRTLWKDLNGLDIQQIIDDLSKMDYIKTRVNGNNVAYEWNKNG
jgi:hypothetical protein